MPTNAHMYMDFFFVTTDEKKKGEVCGQLWRRVAE
jgi:hypothetical protein